MDRHLPVFILNKVYYNIILRAEYHLFKKIVLLLFYLPTKNLVVAAVEFTSNNMHQQRDGHTRINRKTVISD